MSRYVRLGLIALLWLLLLGGVMLWFGGRDVSRITIAAGPSTGESFELAVAIARVLEAGNSHLRVDVYETQGSRENLRLLNSGQVDLAAVQADSSVLRSERAIAVLFADAYQLVVTTESEIDSVAGLLGKRVAIPPAGSGQNDSFWFLLDHFGIQPTDLTALAMSAEAANFAMQQGQVDAVFRVRAPGNELVRELVRDQQGMRLVAIDQPDAMALKKPTLSGGIIPRGSYRGHPALPVTDTQTAIVERVLIAHESFDSELVFKLTQALFDQRAALVRESRLAGFIRPIGINDRISIPLHEGARRYYDREKPSLVQENSRLLATLLYIGALFTSLLVALRARVKRARRVRVSDCNLELMQIAEQTRQVQTLSELDVLRSRLVDILLQVVGDLDAERVTRDEFDHFSFTWQAVDRVVRDQMAVVERAPLAGTP